MAGFITYWPKEYIGAADLLRKAGRMGDPWFQDRSASTACGNGFPRLFP